MLVAFAAVSIVGCGGTQYLKDGDVKGSMEWGPREIKDTVDKMVGSMYTFLKQEYKKPALIQVKPILNKTSEHIETNLVADELTTNLIQKRIKFIDRTRTKEAIKEMEDGMTGMIDPASAVPVGNLKSPNMYLYGAIRDQWVTVGSKRIQYLLVTLQLNSLATSETLWQDQKKFIKATSKSEFSF